MTTIAPRAPTASSRRPFPFLRLALLAFLIGLGVMAVGFRYSYIDHFDPSYELLSQTSTPQGQEHIEIRGKDGKLYTFTGDGQAAMEWSRSVFAQLSARYHDQERHLLGDRLSVAGMVLTGGGLLLAGGGAVAGVHRARMRSRS